MQPMNSPSEGKQVARPVPVLDLASVRHPRYRLENRRGSGRVCVLEPFDLSYSIYLVFCANRPYKPATDITGVPRISLQTTSLPF